MPINSPPRHIKHILIQLQSRGHLAYLVGGCVRDMIIGHRPHKWDICTSALPAQVIELFPASHPVEGNDGCVMVRINSRQASVSTFRSEFGYARAIHGGSLSYVAELNADLKGRDFTVNAIALPADGLVADPFGGVEDIEKKLIRSVGVPEERFENDPMLMLRAFRYCARLDFEIEEKTLAAIAAKAHLAAILPPALMREELEKILMSDRPEMVSEVLGLGLLDAYTDGRAAKSDGYAKLRRIQRKPLYRWAGFCWLLCSTGTVKDLEQFLQRLELDNRTLRCCLYTAGFMTAERPMSRLEWKKLLRDQGVDAVCCSACCRDTFFGGSCRKELGQILKSGECFSMRHLAVSAEDLLAAGVNSEKLQEMLDFLLEYAMEYPENNRRELLLDLCAGSED